MIEEIKRELQRIEIENDIKILYAVESGSRAWGFPSKDSDWDVRFIYVHNYNWYLSIDEKKDTMEFMLPNDLDIAGWELRKTLKLFRKSNPALLEWLQSPLIYLERYSVVDEIRELSQNYFNPKSCTYHYLHMAKGNYQDFFQTDLVKLKKYFYILRPILACQWIETRGEMAPIEFDRLVDALVDDVALKMAIQSLIERKKSGIELGKEPKIDLLNEFIEKQIAYYDNRVKDYSTASQVDTEKLDELFRETLAEVWV